MAMHQLQSNTAPNDVETALVDAALELAAERDWPTIGLMDIADHAEIEAAKVYSCIGSKADLLDAMARRFDQAAAAELDLDRDASVRERVFDAVMARFDAMEPHRSALMSISRGERQTRSATLQAWSWTVRSARWLLELARVETSGISGAARVYGLAALLVRIGRVWERDRAGDLAQTMAALDRALRDVEDNAKRWPFAKKRRSRSARTDEDAHHNAPLSPEADADA